MDFRSILATVMFGLMAGGASAQSSISDITAQLDARFSEMTQVDALLADEDANRRLAAMELLIKSGNPVYAKRATEVGIFSSDVELQRAALRAVFDAGGPFRILINYGGSTDEQNGIKRWLGSNGSWNDTTKIATYIFQTTSFDDKQQCWTFKDSSRCAFTMIGSTISIDTWSNAVGNFELDTSGKLVGIFRYSNGNYAAVPATIPIVE
jgi:hypothetical protein